MSASAPNVTVADVARLVQALEGGAWMTAAELAAVLSGAATESSKRRIRAIASAAGSGVVSYPGSPGYRLWKACTVKDLHACVAAYSSQADEMRRRRDLYRVRLHRENPARIEPDPSLAPSREQLAFF